MASTRRTIIGGAAATIAAAALTWPRRSSAAAGVFTPEMFGAKGDGLTNDSAAMAKLAAAVNLNRGGVVEFRPTTYVVGVQRRQDDRIGGDSYEPAPLLEFAHCTQPLIIRGNRARLRCAGGLRFGVFDAATGEPLKKQMPYFGPGRATPYRYMIRVEGCTGPVTIENIELDGNLPDLLIGGPYGDVGWQIAAVGLALANNRGSLAIKSVYSHHHGQDGLIVDGVDEAGAGGRFDDLRLEYNGRQGCSIVGGRGYVFQRCAFGRTGRSTVASKPGAGLDIEAEGGKRVRGLAFSDCQFLDNVGEGMVADSGDTADVSFTRCTFIGTTAWSAFPNKPYFKFSNCTFVGAVASVFGDPVPSRATRFTDCTFSDDPALAPERRVYGGVNADRPLLDLGDAKNVYFGRCSFLARHQGVLPWSTGAIYENCRLEQKKKASGFPRGVFRGRNTITGMVDLYGSRNEGEVVLNGKSFHLGWTG